MEQMLNTMSSKELIEWRAYELATGPLGSELWLGEAIACVHEELQFIAHLLGQAHFTDKNHKKGPAAKPDRYPRPHQTFKFTNADTDDEEGDGEDDEWVTPLYDTEEDEG